LPFAQSRFVEPKVLKTCLSEGSFGKTNGLEITDGPLAGLHSRVIVVDENGTITHTEQVTEIADEPITSCF
jgi:thiol peroxidase